MEDFEDWGFEKDSAKSEIHISLSFWYIDIKTYFNLSLLCFYMQHNVTPVHLNIYTEQKLKLKTSL